MIKRLLANIFISIVFILTVQSVVIAKTQTIDFNRPGCYIGGVVSWKTVSDGHDYEPTAADLNAFEKIIGRNLAIVPYYRAFLQDGVPYMFPLEFYKIATENGSVIMLTWEPRDWDTTNPYYFEKSLLPGIIAGKYDKYIDKWAADIKKLDNPVLLRFAPEMNTSSFSWSGSMNGSAKSGAKTYIRAYKRVHDRFAKAGVKNVLWVWTPIKWGWPFETWNHYTNYYPGNNYVDIIAMDEYNWGTSQPWSKWTSFKELYWQFYGELTHLYPDKPLIIGEFASADKGGDKAKWIKETFEVIKESFPKIKAFVWFQNDNRGVTVNNMLENSDWRINSNSGCVEAARKVLSDKYYIGGVRIK